MIKSFVYIFSAIILLSAIGVCPAQIYKYKDDKGNWVFTDTPPADVKNMESIDGARDMKRKKQGFTSADEKIDTYEDHISAESEHLEKIEKHLSEYKTFLGTLRNSTFKKKEAAKYEAALKNYQNRKARFHQGMPSG